MRCRYQKLSPRTRQAPFSNRPTASPGSFLGARLTPDLTWNSGFQDATFRSPIVLIPRLITFQYPAFSGFKRATLENSPMTGQSGRVPRTKISPFATNRPTFQIHPQLSPAAFPPGSSETLVLTRNSRPQGRTRRNSIDLIPRLLTFQYGEYW